MKLRTDGGIPSIERVKSAGVIPLSSLPCRRRADCVSLVGNRCFGGLPPTNPVLHNLGERNFIGAWRERHSSSQLLPLS